MSFDSVDDNCKECKMPFDECEAVKSLEEDSEPCESCGGSGMEFEGDLHIGDCSMCGGQG